MSADDAFFIDQLSPLELAFVQRSTLRRWLEQLRDDRVRLLAHADLLLGDADALERSADRIARVLGVPHE